MNLFYIVVSNSGIYFINSYTTETSSQTLKQARFL